MQIKRDKSQQGQRGKYYNFASSPLMDFFLLHTYFFTSEFYLLFNMLLHFVFQISLKHLKMLQNSVISFHIKYQISQRSSVTCKYSKKQNIKKWSWTGDSIQSTV